MTCHRCEANHVPFGCVAMRFYENTVLIDDKPVTLRYNVSAAFAWAERNLQTLEIPHQDAKELIITNLSETFCGAHVDHVNPEIPAICGVYLDKLLLLDGTHRLFRCLKDGRPPMAYVLSEEQLQQFAL